MLQHPSAGAMDVVNRQQNDSELLDCFAVERAMLATLGDCCNMCLGNPLTLWRKEGILWLTVNNELMCIADFCGCVVPKSKDCYSPWGRLLCRTLETIL